jgi:hypothetical protein
MRELASDIAKAAVIFTSLASLCFTLGVMVSAI